jgi:protein-disulfide isomerase
MSSLSGGSGKYENDFPILEMGDLMSVAQKFLALGLGAAFAFAGTNTAFAQNDNTVVAEVGGVKVTISELEREESAKLLAAHYQYYLVETKALDELIDKKLLEQKAKSENLTLDQLMDRDIKSKVTDPTEDQMKVYYEGLETEQPYDAVRGKILEKIRQLRSDKLKAAYVKELREKTAISVALEPPRANVEGIEVQAEAAGSKSAHVTLVEFADYECPYCQKVAADVKKLKADFGDRVAFTYKDFPLSNHSRAEKAAEASRCASKQDKFWEFHDEIFHSKELDVDQLKAQARSLKLDAEQFDKCLDSGETAAAVDRDRKEGLRLGITGTPSFFVNGHYLSGALDYAALRKIVEQQLGAPAQGASSSGK